MVHQVLRHEATFGQDNRLLAIARRRDGNDGGLSKRMDLLKLRGREQGFLVAVEDLDFIRDLELFEQPDDALGAREIQPGKDGGLFLSAECNGAYEGREVMTGR